MKLRSPRLAFLAIVSIAACLISHAALAQNVNCNNGTTLSGTYDNVNNSRGDCTLDGATLRGSVMASGNTVTLDGGTTVSGGVLAEGLDRLELLDATVTGDLSAKDAGHVWIEPGLCDAPADEDSQVNAVGSVKMENSRSLTVVDACIGSIENSGSRGDVVICGSSLLGEVKIGETRGDVSIDSACGASTIDGSISVEKGRGHITIVGATIPSGDLIVVEQRGNVVVESAMLSDVNVEKVNGNVTLRDVTTDSDTTLINNKNITIEDSTLGSDVGIGENLRVTLRGNDFALEDVSVSKNSGPVTVVGNTNFSISISENKRVTFDDNVFTDANISKNTERTRIRNSTGEVLSCIDNSPAPTGSGNDITELADGQCSSF